MIKFNLQPAKSGAPITKCSKRREEKCYDLVDLLISHVMPMSRIQEAFELLAGGECAKVVLKPWE